MGFEFRPCGGVFLQGAVRAVAVADIITTIFAMIFNLVGSINAASTMDEHDSSKRKNLQSNSDHWLIFLTTIYFLMYVVYIVLAVGLFVAATQRSQCKLKIYLSIWAVLVILAFAMFTVHFQKLGGASPFVIVAFVCFHLYKFYSFWVVASFLKEIGTMDIHYNALLRNLNDDEIRLFEKGDPNSSILIYQEGEGHERLHAQPFNRDFEISPERLFIDTDAVLGSGAYGVVSKGILTLENGKKVDIAVKTTKPNADVSYFKALLLEVKMMSFIGPHVNVVNLIGTVTTEIRRRRLWMVVELCLGSVESFLKKNRNKYKNFINHNDQILIPDNEEEIHEEGPLDQSDEYENLSTFTTEDLLVWAHQIAKGMEFLASKKVIHGDLATRNVLISTKDNIVKITDFGLSRKLYNYTSYVKKEAAPLPWRFLPIESLKDMVFSSQSDVWSYGVTLWELFTLGSTPYSGLSWSLEFVERLTQGLRLNKPQNCTTELYDIMMSCWIQEPSHRPTFTTLKEKFKLILGQLNPYDYADRDNTFSFYDGE